MGGPRLPVFTSLCVCVCVCLVEQNQKPTEHIIARFNPTVLKLPSKTHLMKVVPTIAQFNFNCFFLFLVPLLPLLLHHECRYLGEVYKSIRVIYYYYSRFKILQFISKCVHVCIHVKQVRCNHPLCTVREYSMTS